MRMIYVTENCNKIKYTTGYAVQNGGTTLHMIENTTILLRLYHLNGHFMCLKVSSE